MAEDNSISRDDEDLGAAGSETDASSAVDSGAVDDAESTPAIPQPDPALGYLMDGESSIDALIRLTNEHALAAETGSPDQPYILTARRAVSRLVQSNVNDMANLALRNPAYIDVLTADISVQDTASLKLKNIAELLGVRENWDQMTPDTRAIFTNPAIFYRHAKAAHASLSTTARGGYLQATTLDTLAKQYAGRLVSEGRIIDLAMDNPTLARTCLADAGLPKAASSLEAVQAKSAAVQAYLDADRNAVLALGSRDWVAYGVASRARLHLMASIYRDPAAMVALGTIAGEQGIDIRGKAAADHALVRAQLDRGEGHLFDQRLKEFEASFLKDFTVEGSDPVKRWVKIQNEIEAQEKSGVRSGPDLAYLRKISEKTALEVAATPANFKRIAQDRPDLMPKLAMEADKGRESALTLGKETTIATRNDGAFVENRAAAIRNTGASAAEAAARAPEAGNVDRATSDIIARRNEEHAAPATGLTANPADRILRSGAIPPRAPQPTSQAQPAAAQPAQRPAGNPQQAGSAPGSAAGSQPSQGARPAGAQGQAQAQPQPVMNYATVPLNADQVKARNYTSSKHPEFDQDVSDFYATQSGRNLGLYVNARTPYTKSSLIGQLNDTRKLVFAAPLNSFMSDHHRHVRKALKQIAKEDPERFKKMYQATKDTWNAWQHRDDERTRTALDQLEVGRRIMAEVGVITKVLDPAKAATHAKPLYTDLARKLSPKHRWDPGDFMQKRDAKRYAAYLGRLALGKVVDKTYNASAAGWRMGGTRIAKQAIEGVPKRIKQAMNELLDFTA